MLERVEKQIDDHVYSFAHLPAQEALRVLTKLTKIVGEPLAIAVGALMKDDKTERKLGEDGLPLPAEPKKGLLERDVDPEVFGKAARSLIEKLDEEEVIAIVVKLTTQQVLCDGIEIKNFNTHFTGQLGHLFKVLAAALEVQYGNFFGAMIGLTGTVQAGAAAMGIAAR